MALAPLTVPPQHIVGDAGHTTDHDTVYSIMGLSFRPWQFYVNDPFYGALGNGTTVTDGAMGSGGTTLTCAVTTPFTPAVTGMTAIISKAGASGVPLMVTLTYVSASQVTTSSGNVSGGAISNCTVTFGTDDTAAVNSAVTAAYNYAHAHNGYAEVIFDALTYIIAGAPVQGGATLGNAQIPLPVNVASTGTMKVTLAMRSLARDASAQPHALQSTPQQGGTVLACVRTDGTNSGTFDAASVLGGPTPLQGYGSTAGVFNNMLIVIDGITVQVPYNSTYCGFDFRGMAEANVVTAACQARDWPSGPMGTVANITNTWTWGLAMPLAGNGNNANVGLFSCEGLTYGFMPSEHTVAVSVRAHYCITGVEAAAGGGVTTTHSARIVYASVENGTNGLGVFDGAVNISVGELDPLNVVAVYDPSNRGFGQVGLHVATVSVNSAINFTIINYQQAPGVVTAPGVPLTTVALLNPFWRDAYVMIKPGASTCAVSVTGTATGLTLASSGTAGMVCVPSGATITLTYTSAPTWTWVLI